MDKFIITKLKRWGHGRAPTLLLHKTWGVNFLNSKVFDAFVYMLKYQINKNQ